MNTADHLHLLDQYAAHNYSPVAMVAARAQGAWVWDVEGKKYFDMLSAYGAINFGHSNERFKKRAIEQLDRMTMISRAFMNDQMGPFCKDLAELCGLEMVLPMNSGAEAVETAIKAARRWGYQVKKVEPDKAEIICMEGNFSGRTTTIISFSTVAAYKEGFGPLTPGFVIAPFGNYEAIERLITKNTVAIMIEPIQGEGGVIIPPDGYLKKVRELCTARQVLFIADEVQSGLCRSGDLFACDYEQVKPDLYCLGKSLGGGIVPISAVVGTAAVLGVFNPGSHGSTFGGYSFACAVAREVIAYIREEKPHLRARELGAHLVSRLRAMNSPYICEVRGRGLMVGADIKPEYGKAKKFCEKLAAKGVLTKDTRDQTIRFTPPLVSSKEDLDWAIDRVAEVFI